MLARGVVLLNCRAGAVDLFKKIKTSAGKTLFCQRYANRSVSVYRCGCLLAQSRVFRCDPRRIVFRCCRLCSQIFCAELATILVLGFFSLERGYLVADEWFNHIWRTGQRQLFFRGCIRGWRLNVQAVQLQQV